MKNERYFMRIAILFLTAVLLLPCCRKSPADGSLTSGDGGTPTQKKDDTVLTNVYRGTVLNLPEEYGGTYAYKLETTIPGMDRELGTVTVYAEDGTGGGHAVTWSLDSGIVGDIEVPIPEGQQYCAGAFEGDFFRYATAQIEGEPPVEDSVVLNINCLDLETGEHTMSANLRPLFSTADSAQYGLWVSSLAVDTDGDLWLATSDKVLVLSESFQRIASFTDIYNTPRKLTAAPDGTVWLTNRDSVLIFDKKNRNSPQTISMPEKTLRVLFCDKQEDGEVYDFCYTTETGVYGAKRTDGTVEPSLLMSYQNSGVDGKEAVLAGAFDTENLLFVEKREYILYRASEDVDISSLRVIQAACAFNLDASYGTSGFTTRIVEFNKAHPDCRVVLKDYSVYNSDANPYGGTARLLIDMVNGVYQPDIVFCKTRGGINKPEEAAVAEQLVSKGLYRDLSPYLETDDKVNRETVFGAVQTFFSTEDGGMWGIAPCFQFETLIAPTELLEQYASGAAAKGGWTLTELLDYAEALPDDVFLMGTLSQQSAENYILGPDGYAAFIDSEAGEAHFDSPEFLRWLRFFTSLPENTDAAKRLSPVGGWQSLTTVPYYYENKVALCWTRCINGFSDYLEWEETFGGHDYTVIGFPASGHGGTSLTCGSAMVMTSFCRDPDLAWELIRDLMTESSASINSCPTLKEKSRAYVAQFLDHGEYWVVYYTGWERGKRQGYAEDGIYPKQEDLKEPGYVLIESWEKYDRYVELLDKKLGYPMTESMHADVTDIVREEISAFAAGVGTAEDCAKKIQSRVSIWLAEHK